MSSNCVFCRIVAGEIPSTKVYEDADVLAFMDIAPLVKGHTLVIPKAHVDPITAASPETLGKVMAAVQKIVRAQMNGLKADGVNVFQANGAVAGQVVPHLHVHVVPRFENDAHHWNWTTKKYDSADEAAKLAAAMRKAL